MSADERGGSFLHLDIFELDVKSGQLRRNGLPVDLPHQAQRILVLLTTRPNQLVSRKEIKDALWAGQSHGDFDSRLNFTVRKLREALGDDAEQPRYVQTVRKAGYTFIAPVGTVPEIPSSANSPAAGLSSGRIPSPTLRCHRRAGVRCTEFDLAQGFFFSL